MKDLVRDRTADFEAALGLVGDHPVRVLNVDLSTLSAATDIVLGFGDPLKSITDINFQAGRDTHLSGRVLMYNAMLYHRCHVPVHSTVILLRREADDSKLTGRVRYAGVRSKLVFSFEVIRLWRRPVERYVSGGLGSLPLAVLCATSAKLTTEEALRKTVAAIDERLRREADHAAATKIATAAFVLAGLRVSKQTALELFQGVHGMRESTTYQYILDEGRIEEAQNTLLRQGKLRFGKPTKRIVATVQALKDLDRLHELSDRLLSVSSWQELLQTD
jgi:hypothetical protein